MKRYTYMMLAAVVALFFLSAGTGAAQDIKARMKERLPQVLALKAKGLIGENNQGYLQFVGAAKEQEDLVTAENADRRMVYEAIAKQQGTPVDLVGKRRALQLVEMAGPGEWLQNDAGQWYKK